MTHTIPLKIIADTAGLSKDEAAYIENLPFEGKPYDAALVRDNTGAPQCFIVVQGKGAEDHLNYANALDTLRASLPTTAIESLCLDIDPNSDVEAAYHLALAWRLHNYSIKKDKAMPFLSFAKDKAVLERAALLAKACITCRDLVNTPSNKLGPEELEMQVRKLAEKYKAAITITKDKDLVKENYPLVFAVGDSSPRRPRVIEMNWGNKNHPKLSLLGKGVCFDTGGLDIKPPQFMRHMKKDMGGSAHALGLATLIMEHKLPVQLQLLIPAVENSTSGVAFRPGDVCNSRIGKTVEIGDTDAEGRLVLADCMTRAGEETPPDMIIDFATLTGAARVALGYDVPVFFTNNEDIERDLRTLSKTADDFMWPLPIYDGYRAEMNSDVADMDNIGTGRAGAIHGALFLKEFMLNQTIDWVHLDIYAWSQTGRPGRPKGGSDTGLRSMWAYLQKRYN